MNRFWMLAAAVAAGCAADPPATEEDTRAPVPVEAVTVVERQVPLMVSAVGSSEPFARATPGTRLMGRVVEMTVREGDTVSKGDLLVRIEDRNLAAKRQQASSAVAEAEAVLANARATARRIRNLYEEKAVPKQRLDETETALRRAKAGWEAAKGALEEVDANLGYSSIQSPMDGVVVAKFVDEGDMAAPGAPLVTVEQQDPMQVTVQVSEQDLSTVRLNATVRTEIEAAGDGGVRRSAFDGRVDAIVPSGDPSSRTFQVKVVIDNPEGVIRSGMFARVFFPKGTRRGLLIPAEAVFREGQLTGVYEIRDGRAFLRWVRLGRTFGEDVEVVSGLSDGDRIVVRDHAALDDGRAVEVKGP